MSRVVAWVAARLGRAVLALAVTTLLLGIALGALAVHVLGWPYRHASGPSKRRAQIEAALATITAGAALFATLRTQAGPDAGEQDDPATHTPPAQ